MKTLLFILVLALVACSEPPRQMKSAHTHVWGRWSEPRFTSSAWYGTQAIQFRVCDICGQAETRVEHISDGKVNTP